jgi:hypothetical protein
MTDTTDYVASCLERMRAGDADNTFFDLIEADLAVLPVLVEALGKPENREIRPEIVRCIWERRRAEFIGFLAQLLDDPEKAVWQEALDGLVAIGGAGAIGALEAARNRIGESKLGKPIVLEWIEEALEQLQQRLPEKQ